MDSFSGDGNTLPADIKQEEAKERPPQAEAGKPAQTARSEEQAASNETSPPASLAYRASGGAPGWQKGSPTKAGGARSPLVVRLLPLCIITLLFLLIPTLFILDNGSPASSATITVEPQVQGLTFSYDLDASDHTNLAASQVRSRVLSYKTPALSQGTSVQNTQYIPGATAHGTIVFSQLNQEIKLYASLDGIQLADGTIVVMDKDATMEPGNTYTLPVHVQQEGSKGNLPADSIDGYYQVRFGFYTIGLGPPTAYLSNPEPFTGGSDDYTGPVVSQSDTGPVAASLATQASQMAQRYFQAHLQPGEALLDNLTCQQHETDRPAIGTPASSVIVSVSSDCQIQTYDQQGLNQALQVDTVKQLGSNLHVHFALSSPLNVTIVGSNAPGGAISFAVETWSRLVLDKQSIQAVQKALAGHSQDDARNILQYTYYCQVDSLNLSGWGGKIPANPAAIQITAQHPDPGPRYPQNEDIGREYNR